MIKRIKKILPKSEYAKNTTVSIVGVGLAAVIPILLRPFLGRIFTPEEFNLMSLYISVTSILAIPANFRYGYAVAITRTDDEARSVLLGSLMLSFIFSCVTLVVLIFFGELVVSLFHLDKALVKWFYLVPLSCFFISACIGFNGWLTRKKAFKAMASNKIIRRGGEGGFQLLLGNLKIAGGLIYGTLIGDLLNFLVHFFQFRKSDGNFKGITRHKVKSGLKTYIDFPKFNLVPALLDTVSLALPFFMVNARYADETGGQFAQSRDLLSMPLVLISAALSQVLLQKLAEKRSRGEAIVSLINRHVWYLTLLSLLGIAIIYPFGEALFVFFVGDQWGLAGNMASWMVVAYALKFVITPMSVVFFALEKVKIAGFWQVSYFAGMCTLFLLPDIGIYEFILWYVAVEAVFYLIYLVLIYRTSKAYDRSLRYE
ncbi:MAG: oligosaccharide flippase family protein [Bacteroidetes bacterium]|nr:oligosaccharide flippase family protein [Bacteroidota bacterium]